MCMSENERIQCLVECVGEHCVCVDVLTTYCVSFYTVLCVISPSLCRFLVFFFIPSVFSHLKGFSQSTETTGFSGSRSRQINDSTSEHTYDLRLILSSKQPQKKVKTNKKVCQKIKLSEYLRFDSLKYLLLSLLASSLCS